jgi:hypothetical protein
VRGEPLKRRKEVLEFGDLTRDTVARAQAHTALVVPPPPTRSNIWLADRAATAHSSETDPLYRKIYCAFTQMNSTKCDLQTYFNNPVRHHKEDPGSILCGKL